MQALTIPYAVADIEDRSVKSYVVTNKLTGARCVLPKRAVSRNGEGFHVAGWAVQLKRRGDAERGFAPIDLRSWTRTEVATVEPVETQAPKPEPEQPANPLQPMIDELAAVRRSQAKLEKNQTLILEKLADLMDVLSGNEPELDQPAPEAQAPEVGGSIVDNMLADLSTMPAAEPDDQPLVTVVERRQERDESDSEQPLQGMLAAMQASRRKAGKR